MTALNTAETSGLPVNLAAPGVSGNGTYAYGWAASGYVEEARAAATPALLPGVVEDPCADVSSPTFSAYRRERRAAECLDGVLAILALVSSQALLVTGREPARAAVWADPRERSRLHSLRVRPGWRAANGRFSNTTYVSCLRSSWRHRTYRRSGGLPVRSSASSSRRT